MPGSVSVVVLLVANPQDIECSLEPGLVLFAIKYSLPKALMISKLLELILPVLSSNLITQKLIVNEVGSALVELDTLR
jgi:hypothetical protein